MVIFDTNAVLRYILRDNPVMLAEVKRQLSFGNCYIPVEVVAEIVYVLSKVYNVQRKDIAKTITNLTFMDNIKIARENVVLHAICVYATTTFDFVDCLMAGYKEEEYYTIFTFDKKLRKYLDK
jgi:predicted nucleic-acid-binding protein